MNTSGHQTEMVTPRKQDNNHYSVAKSNQANLEVLSSLPVSTRPRNWQGWPLFCLESGWKRSVITWPCNSTTASCFLTTAHHSFNLSNIKLAFSPGALQGWHNMQFTVVICYTCYVNDVTTSSQLCRPNKCGIISHKKWKKKVLSCVGRKWWNTSTDRWFRVGKFCPI